MSQSVKQLETALQARLFARSPRGVSLTSEGQMLYQYVRSALGLLATGEDKLSQAQQLLLGTLVIGASDTVTSQFLVPYLDDFHRLHPGIRLKIVSGRSAKVLSMLKSGAVDIAFASSPADSAVESWPCFATHSAFVAGSGYDCDFDHVYTRREIAHFPSWKRPDGTAPPAAAHSTPWRERQSGRRPYPCRPPAPWSASGSLAGDGSSPLWPGRSCVRRDRRSFSPSA